MILGRKTLQSRKVRMRRIDHAFERIGQGLLIVSFLFVLTIWMAERNSLRIQRVEVSGALNTDGEAIRVLAEESLTHKLLSRIPRDNALLYPKHALADSILALDSRIKSVGMKVGEKKELAILVTEYTPENLWCDTPAVDATLETATPCYLADADGYVFAAAPNYSGYPFTVYRTAIAGSEEEGTPIGLFVLPKDEFAILGVFTEALTHAGIIVKEIDHVEGHDYVLSSNEPWTLTWSSTLDPEKSVENLKLVLANIKGTGASTTPKSIDLRFGNKVFFK